MVSIKSSNPIQIDGEVVEVTTDLIFLGSKIHRDVDGSCEIKRCLLGRETKTKYQSVVISHRKQSITKAMVFLSVTYGYGSWSIRNYKWTKVDIFELCWKNFLKISWISRRINHLLLNEVKPDCSMEILLINLMIIYFENITKARITSCLEK